MSNAHRGSLLQLSGKLITVDNNTTFLAHYDITENDVLFGVAPNTGAVFTMRPLEGKFGGGIAVEEGTTNIITNGDFTNTKINNSVGWDNSLNGTLVPNGGWGNGYNSGVLSANIGYHAHLNNTMFGYPVLEFIDMNSQFGASLKHRWLGFSEFLSNNVSGNLGWSGGANVTISFDMMVDNVNKGINTGLYHQDTGNVYTFSNTQKTVYATSPYEWQRVSNSFILDSNWNLTSGSCSVYIYGQYSLNDYEGIGWVKNVQVETKSYGTSFTNGNRANGTLVYQSTGIVSGEEGTLNFYINPSSFTPSSSYTDCLDFKNSSNTSNRFIILRKNSGKNTPDQMFIRNGSSWIAKTITLNPNQWSMITWSWKNGNTYNMYINGQLLYSGNYTIGDTDFDKFIFQPVGMIDELRIDSTQRTDEEIMSWYISSQPFYPKGIYRLAY